MSDMLIFEGASKSYGTVRAVRDLSLSIPEGEFFGLLGPNGAGKTTLVRMASCLISPDAGKVTVDGHPAGRGEVAAKGALGVVPQYSNLEGDLTVRENLDYHGRLYRMDRARRKDRGEELMEFFSLMDKANAQAKTLSGGLARRLMIAKGMMHEPKCLLLDEPTVGLDPYSRRRIWDLLRNINAKGVTILLTTHYLDEAQALCGRVGLIDQGSLLRLGTPASLIDEVGAWTVELFEDEATRRSFFRDFSAASTFARDRSECSIRATNLEDAFVALTDKPLGA